MTTTTLLPLAGEQIAVRHVQDARDLPIDGTAIVLNLGPAPAYGGQAPRTPIPALGSTILRDTTIERADAVLLLRTGDHPPAELTTLPDWRPFSALLPGYPAGVPLWRGPRLDLGEVPLDGRPHRVDVNLWYAPAGTDCGIHDRHEFLEVHTQVLGLGRMQKFTAPDHATLYEDVPQAPGGTHAPFCLTDQAGFTYPWHQYHADTDCVWLAVELSAI